MYLIIGLGNPGKQYEKTRHNVGFMAVDELARLCQGYGGQDFKFKKNNKLKSEIAEIKINNQKAVLAKPLTYMNNSGQAAQILVNYYKIPVNKLIVIYDEIDLLFGTIRVRGHGSSAGHKGVQSIIDSLDTDQFWRVRLGIRNEKTEQMPTDKFVLQKFSRAEYKELKEKILPAVLEKVLEIIT